MTESDIRHSVRLSWWTYALALGLVGALLVGGYAMLDGVMRSQRADAAVLNEAGRQRMLSQRIALSAKELEAEPGGAQSIERLLGAIETMRAAYAVATADRAQMSPALRRIYEEPQMGVDDQLARFLADADLVATAALTGRAPDGAAVARLRAAAAAPLLTRLNDAVTQRQAEAEAKLNEGLTLHAALLGVALLCLAAEAAFVFAPLARSHRRALHEAMEAGAARDRAERVNEDQRRFVGMVNHELRTPLSVIDGNARRLVRHAHNQSDEPLAGMIVEAAETTRRAVKRLVSLSEAVLDHTRIASGEMRPDRRPTDVAALVGDVVAQIKAGAPDRVWSIVIPGAPVDYTVDPTMTAHIVENLVGNAVKYSDAGGRVEVRLRCDAHGFQIEVADDGVGIPDAEQKDIFKPFVRASTSVGRVGTGVGLDIVATFVAMHGGDITVDSAVDQGSCFRVVIPTPALASPAQTQAAAG